MSVGDIVHTLTWYWLPPTERFIVHTFIQRSQQSFELKGLGVFVCLEAFSKVGCVMLYSCYIARASKPVYWKLFSTWYSPGVHCEYNNSYRKWVPLFRWMPVAWNCLKNSFWSWPSLLHVSFIRMYTYWLSTVWSTSIKNAGQMHTIMLCSSLAYTYLISDLERVKVDTGQCTLNNIYYSVYGTMTQTIILTWTASKQWKTMKIACAVWAMTSNCICFFAVGCHEEEYSTIGLVICDRFADIKSRNENSTRMYSNFNIAWLGHG